MIRALGDAGVTLSPSAIAKPAGGGVVVVDGNQAGSFHGTPATPAQ